MRRPATNILFLVICCLWPTAGANNNCLRWVRARCRSQSGEAYNQCLSHFYHTCAGGNSGAKCRNHACLGGNVVIGGNNRTPIDELERSIDLRAEGEGPDRRQSDAQEARGEEGERRGRARVSYAFRDTIEGDFRQLLEEKQLLDVANHQTSPGPVPLEEEEDSEQWQEDPEQPIRNNTDTGRHYSIRYTLTMLRKILDDIERRIDSPSVSDSSE